MAKKNGYQAMITQHAWMFLSSFERMRERLLHSVDIVTLAHLGVGTFVDLNSKVVQSVCFVFQNNHVAGYIGRYDRLFEQQGIYENNQEKEKWLISGKHKFLTKQESFFKIPGSPVAYWVSDNLLNDFSIGEILKKKGDTRQGMATSDNNRFLRLWHEIAFNRLGLGCKSAEDALALNKKWYPYNKGGEFRKWYGNIDYTVNYENDGFEIKGYASSLYKSSSRTIKSMSEYFKPCLSWSKISSGSIAFRYYPDGFIFDVAGCCIFYENMDAMFYDFGFLNSIVSKEMLSAISPTLNYEAGHIASLPVIRREECISHATELTQENISIGKDDWDSYETSWDFKRNPLV